MDDSGSLVSGLSVDTIAASAPTARPGSDYPAGSLEEISTAEISRPFVDRFNLGRVQVGSGGY